MKLTLPQQPQRNRRQPQAHPRRPSPFSTTRLPPPLSNYSSSRHGRGRTSPAKLAKFCILRDSTISASMLRATSGSPAKTTVASPFVPTRPTLLGGGAIGGGGWPSRVRRSRALTFGAEGGTKKTMKRCNRHVRRVGVGLGQAGVCSFWGFGFGFLETRYG